MRSIAVLLLRRFGQTCRSDGVSAACGKAFAFLMRRILPRMQKLGSVQPVLAGEDYLMPLWLTLAQENAFSVRPKPQTIRKQRQIALIGDLNLPQCKKYRVQQLAEFWHKRGVRVEFAHYEDLPRATRLLQVATHLVEYRLPASPVTRMLRYEARRLGLPILYDIDDPLFSVEAYETYGNMKAVDPAQHASFLRSAPGYLEMLNGADAVSVSTPGMAELACNHTRRPVFLRRNFADEETLQLGLQASNDREPSGRQFRFAFVSGSQGHEADLRSIVPMLSQVITAAPDRRFMVVGHFNKAWLPRELLSQTEFYPFQDYPDYLNILDRADCALIPLGNDLFNSCKSGVRILDASAVGVPSLASAVGDMPRLIDHQRTGWIVASEADWLSQLEKCAADRQGTKDAGAASRKLIETDWAATNVESIISADLLDWMDL